MTSTLERPASPPPAGAAGSPLVAGATSALWAVSAGLVAFALPVLLVWATDSRGGSGAAAALRGAAQVWLVAHGTSLHVPGGVFGLTPMGLTALPLCLLWRAGRHAARTSRASSPGAALRLTSAIAGPYGLGVALLASLASGGGVQPAPVQALLGGLLVGALGAGAGVVRECGCMRAIAGRLPRRVRGLCVGAAAALLVLLAAACLLGAAALALHGARAAVLARSTDPGVVGGLVLLLLGLMLVPNAAVWALAWIGGPGFAVGVGTAVSPFSTQLGPVPALPLLAALPSGPAPGWATLVLVVPVLAGAVAGVVVAPRLRVSALRAAGEAALLGPCTGVAVALLAAASGGPAGGGRLSSVGPSPWQVGLAVAAEVGLGAAAAAAVLVRSRADRALT